MRLKLWLGWGITSHGKLYVITSLLWRHNGRDSVSNHKPHHCLLNRLFGRKSKKTSKLRVTGLCAGNSQWPVTRNIFPFDDVIMCSSQCIMWFINIVQSLTPPHTWTLWITYLAITFLIPIGIIILAQQYVLIGRPWFTPFFNPYLEYTENDPWSCIGVLFTYQFFFSVETSSSDIIGKNIITRTVAVQEWQMSLDRDSLQTNKFGLQKWIIHCALKIPPYSLLDTMSK